MSNATDTNAICEATVCERKRWKPKRIRAYSTLVYVNISVAPIVLVSVMCLSRLAYAKDEPPSPTKPAPPIASPHVPANPPQPVASNASASLSSNQVLAIGLNLMIYPPLPTNVAPTVAADYCRSMELTARNDAREATEWGWGFGIAAAGAIATGPIIIAAEGSSPTRSEKVTSLAIPAGGALLGYIASALFARAKDHGTLAAQASLALNEPSSVSQVIACNSALAAWNTARSESSASVNAAISSKKQERTPPTDQVPASPVEKK